MSRMFRKNLKIRCPDAFRAAKLPKVANEITKDFFSDFSGDFLGFSIDHERFAALIR